MRTPGQVVIDSFLEQLANLIDPNHDDLHDVASWICALEITTARMRLYHVVVINERTGLKVYMTATPVTHAEGCTILSKLTKYPWRREQLEEV